MIDILRALSQLFQEHAPETLMALFGAGTSILLFYLIGSVLRQSFGLQSRSANWEAAQDQTTAALVEALVGALITESSHLRTTLDSILEEALRRSEQNAQLLVSLSDKTAAVPEKTLKLLRPEFDHLRRELRQAEARLMAKIACQAGGHSEESQTQAQGPEAEI